MKQLKITFGAFNTPTLRQQLLEQGFKIKKTGTTFYLQKCVDAMNVLTINDMLSDKERTRIQKRIVFLIKNYLIK